MVYTTRERGGGAGAGAGGGVEEAKVRRGAFWNSFWTYGLRESAWSYERRAVSLSVLSFFGEVVFLSFIGAGDGQMSL